MRPEDLAGGEWDSLNRDIIALGFNVWRVVSPVVASDSPEGHLPMDRTQAAAPSPPPEKEDDRGFDLYCAVLDRVVVSDVYPDEIVRDILADLLEQTAASSEGGEERRPKPSERLDLSSLLAEHGTQADREEVEMTERPEGASKVSLIILLIML